MSDESSLKNLGGEFIKKGFPEIGKGLIRMAGKIIKNHPVGGVLDDIGVLDGIGKALGVDPDIKTIEKTIDSMTPEKLQSYEKLKELEVQIAIQESQERMNLEDNETERVKSVNETIRAEVLANPESSSWRPLWGRWTCYNFFPVVYLLVALLAYSIISKQFEIVAQFPAIVGAIALLFGLPAAILGVASWGRSGERKELAKNLTKD